MSFNQNGFTFFELILSLMLLSVSLLALEKAHQASLIRLSDSLMTSQALAILSAIRLGSELDKQEVNVLKKYMHQVLPNAQLEILNPNQFPMQLQLSWLGHDHKTHYLRLKE